MAESDRFDAGLYRAAMRLFPPQFRREFTPQMLRDFQDARHEARIATPRGGLWPFRARMCADLLQSLLTQWLRSGWPLIVLMAIAIPLVGASALARFWRRAQIVWPATTPDGEAIGLILLATVALLIITTTLVLTMWFVYPLLQRRRR